MHAVWYDRVGPAHEVLQSGELPTPQAGPGEVRVRLHASGVNPADCNRRAGRGWTMEYPRVIPDSDGAGVVDQVGAGADASLLGARVWLYNGQRGRAFGTAAQWIALDAGLVTRLPDAVSYDAGACLGIPCMTAWHAVLGDGPVAGSTVLVQGGAGAVGHAAAQIALQAGATVIATARGDAKVAHARTAGDVAVVDPTREDLVARVRELTVGRGVDRIVEVDFGGNLAADLAMIAANGTIATYASRGEPQPRVPIYDLMRANVTVRAILLPGLPAAARRAAQHGVDAWLRTGTARVTVSATFPLERTADAHVAVESGTKLGTVVVRCA